MSEETLLSVESLLFAIFIVLLIILKVKNVVGKFHERSLFMTILVLFLSSLGLELSSCFFDGRPEIWARTANILVLTLYFMLSILQAFYWMRFICALLDKKRVANKIMRGVCLVPLAVGLLSSFFSVWTGWVFYFDDRYLYVEGPFYSYYILCCGVYIVASFVITFRHAIAKEHFADRDFCLALCGFMLFPAIGVLLELFYRLTTSSQGIVLGLLLTFSIVQSRKISRDPLTGLNNRNHLRHFLESQMKREFTKGKLCLFVLDVDDFKHINDSFGHGEGDNALLTVASVLKKVCVPEGYFFARFGGDEFNVVADIIDDVDASLFSKKLNDALVEVSASRPYKLKISVGYSFLKGKNDSIPDLFKRADDNLYEHKAQIHGNSVKHGLFKVLKH